MTAPPSATVAEVAALVGGEVIGDATRLLHGLAPHGAAGADQLTFLDRVSPEALDATEAAAVLVAEDPGVPARPTLIVVGNVRLALAQLLAAFLPAEPVEPGVHPSAVVDESAELGEDVTLGPCAVVGAGCRIGRGSRIDAGVVLYRDVVVGDECHLQARSVLREGTVLGDRVILQPGVVLGADGFGYAQTPEHTHVKIPQVGKVVVEDDVEIGAGSCIDRATMGVTRIRQGAKIDNLVQIGHNCDIGDHVILCGQVGIAGSCVIEHHAMLGGQVGLAGHLRIGAGAQLGAQSGAHADLPAGAKVIGSPPIDGRAFARMVAAMPRLPELMRRIRQLERRIDDLAGGESAEREG